MPYVVSGNYNITDILLHTVFDGRGLSFFVLWIFIESGADCLFFAGVPHRW